MQTDGILFDLDGTLWDAVDEIILTWNRVIARYPGLRPPITRAEQETVMGLQMNEIADRLFSREAPRRRMALMEECVQEENRFLRRHGARLYPLVPETLELLSRQFRLFIVSNCQSGYIEAFLAAHGLGRYFTGSLCYGDTGRGKDENIAAVVQRYGLRRPVYVGDTGGDQRAAQTAGVPFVFAAYGFGRADRFEAAVQAFAELKTIFSE